MMSSPGYYTKVLSLLLLVFKSSDLHHFLYHFTVYFTTLVRVRHVFFEETKGDFASGFNFRLNFSWFRGDRDTMDDIIWIIWYDRSVRINNDMNSSHDELQNVRVRPRFEKLNRLNIRRIPGWFPRNSNYEDKPPVINVTSRPTAETSHKTFFIGLHPNALIFLGLEKTKNEPYITVDTYDYIRFYYFPLININRH